MSEWGYLARIIKDAKKAGKQSGKRLAKYKSNPELKPKVIKPEGAEIVDDMSAYNQQLRNFLDGIQSERLTNIDDFDETLDFYTSNAAQDLFNTLYSNPSKIDRDVLYNLNSIAERVPTRDWVIPSGAFIDTDKSKLRNIDALEEAIKRKKFMEGYTNYINKQKSLGKNVAPLEDWYLDEPFDINKAARDILEEKAAIEGRKLNGEFKLERPDGSGL